jgi:hypothetical protein
MKCPYYIDDAITGSTAMCFGVVVPFEPSRIDQIDYCTTGRHRHCPLYRNAGRDLSLAIHQEVSRAIG